MVDVISEHITFPSGGAEIKAYLARPESGGRFPALILIHEIWGVNQNIEDIARRFASQGYIALAPDLYSRSGIPVSKEDIARAMAFIQALPLTGRAGPNFMQEEMAKLPESDRLVMEKTMQWLMHRDYAQNIEDLKAALSWLNASQFVDTKRIASLGFCMGGTLSGRRAGTGAALAASIIFYGESVPDDQIAKIGCPVLGMYGGEDHRITDTVPQFDRRMKESGKSFTYKIYPGAYHAFFNDSNPKTYNSVAASDAWTTVLGFLSSNLSNKAK
jgi:carboxymethylenebutenolidase